MNTLSARLGDRNFLFGDSPRSLDATLFAYLAPLLKTPFPDSILQNHLKGYPNLIKYVDRILRQYYPNCLKGNNNTKNIPEHHHFQFFYPLFLRHDSNKLIFSR